MTKEQTLHTLICEVGSLIREFQNKESSYSFTELICLHEAKKTYVNAANKLLKGDQKEKETKKWVKK